MVKKKMINKKQLMVLLIVGGILLVATGVYAYKSFTYTPKMVNFHYFNISQDDLDAISATKKVGETYKVCNFDADVCVVLTKLK
jgi:hypothetical protein